MKKWIALPLAALLAILSALTAAAAGPYTAEDLYRAYVGLYENEAQADKAEDNYRNGKLDMTGYYREKARLAGEAAALQETIEAVGDALEPARTAPPESYRLKLDDAQNRRRRNARRQADVRARFAAGEITERHCYQQLLPLCAEQAAIARECDGIKWQSLHRSEGEHYDLQEKLWAAKYEQQRNQQAVAAVEWGHGDGAFTPERYDTLSARLAKEARQLENRVVEVEGQLSSRGNHYAVSEDLYSDYYPIVARLEVIKEEKQRLEWRYEDGRTPLKEYREKMRALEEEEAALREKKRSFGNIE